MIVALVLLATLLLVLAFLTYRNWALRRELRRFDAVVARYIEKLAEEIEEYLEDCE